MRQLVSLTGVRRVEEVLALMMDYDDPAIGRYALFELGGTSNARFLSDIRPLVSGRVKSIQAGCLDDRYFPNLASKNPKVLSDSLESLEMDLELALKFKAEQVVIPMGFATDRALPCDPQELRKVLNSSEFLPYLMSRESLVCNREYVDSPVYLEYLERAGHQVSKFAKQCKREGIRLVVKNLSPKVTALCQTPTGMELLASYDSDVYLGLDTGHLWVSSCLYRFDYLNAIRQVLSSGKVSLCSLHSNRSCPEMNGKGSGVFSDDHESLDKNGYPCNEIVALAMKYDVDTVVETGSNHLYNMKLLDRHVMANKAQR